MVVAIGNQVPRWEVRTFHQLTRKGEVHAIVTFGIDLAKNVFAVHGVGAAGKPVLVRLNVACVKLLELIASLPPCLIGMQACYGADDWACLIEGFGHTRRMMVALPKQKQKQKQKQK